MMAAETARAGLHALLDGLPRAVSPLAPVNRLRAHAVDRVGALTVPTAADERWRFTDLSPLTGRSFLPVLEPTRLQADVAAPLFLEETSARLAFVDGVFAPALSSAGEKSGVVAANLPQGASANAAAIETHLGRQAGCDDNLFTALNTAFLHDGALVIVPRNARVTAPVHLLFISTQKDAASHPRCLVVAEAGSEVTVVEEYVALHEEAYLTNAVTEMSLGEQASVNHVRLQRESNAAFHIATCAVTLGRDSRYRSVGVTLGARLSRLDLGVSQAGPGTECDIDGLALISGSQLADTHTTIDHASPHGRSRQLHKCIAGGSAHAVFHGLILVRPGAQHTDSSQSSRNLLLSAKAVVDTQPQLEIFADDVKCAHGATVGQLAADEVFYLRSRGLPDAAARSLLTYAFGAEVIARIPVPALLSRLEKTVRSQLDQAVPGAQRSAP